MGGLNNGVLITQLNQLPMNFCELSFTDGKAAVASPLKLKPWLRIFWECVFIGGAEMQGSEMLAWKLYPNGHSIHAWQ